MLLGFLQRFFGQGALPGFAHIRAEPHHDRTGRCARQPGGERRRAAAMKERLVMLFNLISKNDSAFHHEFYALHFGDVGQWIA